MATAGMMILRVGLLLPDAAKNYDDDENEPTEAKDMKMKQENEFYV